MRATSWTSALVLPLLSAAVGACTDATTTFDRSCRGETVLACDPHQYTMVRDATFTPDGLRPNDPDSVATITVTLATCDAHEGAPSVHVEALLSESRADAGRVRVVDLGLQLRDDGTRDDLVADDGVIQASAMTPFAGGIPGDSSITLRFVPTLAGCDGQALERDEDWRAVRSGVDSALIAAADHRVI